MEVIDTGNVITSRPRTDGASCCFPSICVLETGRWVAGFRLGPAKLSRTQRAFISWSDDEGKTWSSLVQPAQPLPHRGRPGSWRSIVCTALGGQKLATVLWWEDVSEPFLPMFNEQTEGLMDMKQFVTVSQDGGEHFGDARVIDCGKYRSVPTPCTGALLLLPDGRWVVPFEVNKHYNDTAPWQHASALVISGDHGKSWSEAFDAHTDPARRIFCWDQRLALLNDGSILALFWTYDRQTSEYLPIHARRSRDGGQSWGDLVSTGVLGQPARAVALNDGGIIMVYVDRTAEPIIKARRSDDGGRTWPAEGQVVVHRRSDRVQGRKRQTMQDAWAEMSVYSVGLPDTARLPNGDVLAVYYTGDHPDYTDICWTRIRP